MCVSVYLLIQTSRFAKCALRTRTIRSPNCDCDSSSHKDVAGFSWSWFEITFPISDILFRASRSTSTSDFSTAHNLIGLFLYKQS